MEWPGDWPPVTFWKKFLLGLPLVGPDVPVFKDLKEQQAARTSDMMSAWGEELERLLLAECYGRMLSEWLEWKTPYFLPRDNIAVIAAGPVYRDIDELSFEQATLQLERLCGAKIPESFWEMKEDLTLGSVIDFFLEAGFVVPTVQ